MNTESKYEKMYNDLVAGLNEMHKKNVGRTRDALKSLLIIPTIFLIMLFLTKSSKTIFLVLWIASMFIIAAVLIIVEYQDYLLRKMFSQVDMGDNDDIAKPEVIVTSSSSDEALMRAGLILDEEKSPTGGFEYGNTEEAAVETASETAAEVK